MNVKMLQPISMKYSGDFDHFRNGLNCFMIDKQMAASGSIVFSNVFGKIVLYNTVNSSNVANI